MKIVLSIVALVAFAGMSFAQQAPAAAPAAAPAKMEKPVAKKEVAKKTENFGGEISAIDTVKNEITVKNEKGVEKTFAVEAAKLAALAQGQKVKVTVAKDGKVTVKAIVKHEGKHAGKKAEKKADAPVAPAAGK